jgi:hypothetical protein
VASTDALFSAKVAGAPPEQPAAAPMKTRSSASLSTLLYKLTPMGHLDSQRSLPTFGGDKNGFSLTAKKLRLAPGQRVAGYKPDAFVAIDDRYTALRFKRV